MRVETLLRLLEQRQVELAKSLLAAPLGRDAFEFGRSAGLYAGIQMARDEILAFYEDAEKDSRK